MSQEYGLTARLGHVRKGQRRHLLKNQERALCMAQVRQFTTVTTWPLCLSCARVEQAIRRREGVWASGRAWPN